MHRCKDVGRRMFLRIVDCFLRFYRNVVCVLKHIHPVMATLRVLVCNRCSNTGIGEF